MCSAPLTERGDPGERRRAGLAGPGWLAGRYASRDHRLVAGRPGLWPAPGIRCILAKVPGLSREVVAAAALRLADEHGTGAVRLRRLSGELNVTPMALYRHVQGKQDLLDAVTDLLYAELRVPAAAADWWRPLAALARSARRVSITHPAARELFARPAEGPHARRVTESLHALLRAAGFGEREAGELHEQLTAMVFALSAASSTDAAFERGLELIRAGLVARLTAAT